MLLAPSCCCDLPLLDVHHFIYSVIHPQNMHTDCGLHFLTNLSIRVTRVTGGWCCHIGGEAETAFYSAFNVPRLRGVGFRKQEVTQLMFLGRHVDFLRDALAPIACIVKQYPDCPKEVPLLIEYFCILVSLLKAWKVTEVQMREISHCAVGITTAFFLVWPTPEDMFAYWPSLMQKSVARQQIHSTDSDLQMAWVSGLVRWVTVRQWKLWATTFYLQHSCPAGSRPCLYTKFL